MKNHLCLWLVVLLCGCSLQVLDRVACESNTECRIGFGLTSFCAQDGFCSPLELPDRCSSFPENVQDDPEFSDAVLYGVMVDRSAEGDRRAQRAATLAVDLANRQGGLNAAGTTRPFALVVCDYQSDVSGESGYSDGDTRLDAAKKNAQFLVDSLQPSAILGPTTSTETEVVYAEVTREAGTLLLSPNADAASLTDLDAADLGLLWRTVPPENAVIEQIVGSLLERSVSNAFIVAPEGVGGASATLLQNRLMDAVSDIRLSLRLFEPEGSDLVSAINEAAESSAEEVIFLGDHVADSVRFLEVAVGDNRFSDKSLFFDASANDPALLAADAASAFGTMTPAGSEGTNEYQVRVARHSAAENVTTSNFRNQYRSEYGNEDPLPYPAAVGAWDGMWMLMLATSSPQSEQSVLGGVGTLGLGLRSLSASNVTNRTSLDPSSWRAAQEALRAGESLNIEGASGDLDYDLVSEELGGTAKVSVIELEGGRFRFVDEP